MVINMKRTFLMVAALCLLAAVLLFAGSCAGESGEQPIPTDASTGSSGSSSGTSAGTGTGTDTVVPTDPGAVIAGETGSVFSIVYPARWSDYEMNAAMDLQTVLARFYASVPNVTDDKKTAADGAYEILIGNTNRPESAAVLEGLNDYGWAIRVIGNRVVINATQSQFLSDAVNYFVYTYVGSAEQIGINHIREHIENSEKHDQLYVISVGERSAYTVSCLSSGSNYLKSSALAFTKTLKDEQNVSISASFKDGTTGKMILLKADETVDGWKIVFEENGNILICGKNDGLAVCALNYFSSEYMKKDADGDILIKNTQTVSDPAEDYMRAGWLLAVPAYEGGTLAQRLYDCGMGMQNDNSSPNAERSFMMCVSGTTAAQFDNYLGKLSSCGYTVDSENTVPCSNGKYNLFCGYRKGSQYLWVYYLAKTGEVRVIEDRVSTPESEFEYSFDYDGNTATELYLYGMKYHPLGIGYGGENGSTDNCNNGTFIIIKQADNSVFLIDGGFFTQATPTAINGLWTFLHEITGKAENEKIVISCWFITHPHGDHYAFVSSLITCYNEYLDLQRVMFNFPNPSELSGKDTGIDSKIRTAVCQYFPDAMFSKCHTGQSIRLGSMTIDVMTTQEDAVSATTGKNTMTEGNSMTSVLRFTFADGTRYMELGDFTEERENALLEMYPDAEFKCDVSDVAHHGFNRVQRLYNKIAARYIFWSNYPADEWLTETESAQWRKIVSGHTLQYVQAANPNVKIYYAGLNTAKLECKNKEIAVTLTDPVY